MLSTASKPRVASLSISVLFSVNVQLKIDLQKKVKETKVWKWKIFAVVSVQYAEKKSPFRLHILIKRFYRWRKKNSLFIFPKAPLKLSLRCLESKDSPKSEMGMADNKRLGKPSSNLSVMVSIFWSGLVLVISIWSSGSGDRLMFLIFESPQPIFGCFRNKCVTLTTEFRRVVQVWLLLHTVASNWQRLVTYCSTWIDLWQARVNCKLLCPPLLSCRESQPAARL